LALWLEGDASFLPSGQAAQLAQFALNLHFLLKRPALPTDAQCNYSSVWAGRQQAHAEQKTGKYGHASESKQTCLLHT
jgi:hypothetical protein